MTKVKLARSRKTANSKGFCFVEFEDREVAEVAAASIEGYMINGKVLTSHLMEDNIFRHASARKRYLPVDWRKLYRQQRNRELTR